MKNLISGILAVALVAGPASAQQVTTRLPSATVKLNGSSGGGGDITAVDITTTAPITGGANCASGACAFTLGLTGGTLSGLTATKLPVATSATAVGDSAITHNSTTGAITGAGTGPYFSLKDHSGGATYGKFWWDGADWVLVNDAETDTVGLTLKRVTASQYITAGLYYTLGDTLTLADDGQDPLLGMWLKNGGGISWPNSPTADTRITRDAAGQLGVYGAGSTYGQLNVGSIQQSYSKALVDATATDVVQVPVASNSYEGFTLDYTIFATDATDYQVRQGSVPVAVLNVGGTETCVFGTATEAVNASVGTLTVAFDCTAGTNTVMVRANADTSLASTTIFTIQQRINLTSGTAVLVPQ